MKTARFSFVDLKRQLGNLSYRLERNAVDNFGRRWNFAVRPNFEVGGGSTNYFTRLEDVQEYANRVDQIRTWQSGG